MFDYLTAAGFHICDTGQYEMVATRAVPIDEISIMAAISQMRQLASERGYRLLSVEAGDIEGGTAHVLASEKDYIPWWEVTG